MQLPPSPQNAALAGAVNSRIKADAAIIAAKATGMKLAGAGALLALTGLGFGAAFFGYSYITDSRASAEKIAQAFTDALNRTTLKTEGEVKLDSNAKVAMEPGEVKLDPDATVRLDASGTTVRLDPNAQVGVRGSVGAEIPRPSPRQLGSDMPAPQGATVVTNFTVFKSQTFSKGRVVSGWNFTSSEDTQPNHQYCYYTTEVETGLEVKVNLGVNGRPVPAGANRAGLDITSAYRNCMWFGGGSTSSAPPSNYTNTLPPTAPGKVY